MCTRRGTQVDGDAPENGQGRAQSADDTGLIEVDLLPLDQLQECLQKCAHTRARHALRGVGCQVLGLKARIGIGEKEIQKNPEPYINSTFLSTAEIFSLDPASDVFPGENKVCFPKGKRF
eukprot:112220-Prorocentrum_minimum.AAC.9